MNTSLLDWDGLRVFLAVAERRSFSAGARALNISQPTAGRRVEALGFALLGAVVIATLVMVVSTLRFGTSLRIRGRSR